MTTGEKLKKLRNQFGLTQNQLCEKLNGTLSKNTIYNAEHDNCKKKGANDSTLTVLADFYNVDIEYLRDENCDIMHKSNLPINETLGFSEDVIKKIESLGSGTFDYFITDDDDEKDQIISIYKNSFNIFLKEINIEKLINYLEDYRRINQIKDLFLQLFDQFDNLRIPSFHSQAKILCQKCDTIFFELEKIFKCKDFHDPSSSLVFKNDTYYISMLNEYDNLKNNYKTYEEIDFQYVGFQITEDIYNIMQSIENEIGLKKYLLSSFFENYISSIGNSRELKQNYFFQ